MTRNISLAISIIFLIYFGQINSAAQYKNIEDDINKLYLGKFDIYNICVNKKIGGAYGGEKFSELEETNKDSNIKKLVARNIFIEDVGNTNIEILCSGEEMILLMIKSSEIRKSCFSDKNVRPKNCMNDFDYAYSVFLKNKRLLESEFGHPYFQLLNNNSYMNSELIWNFEFYEIAIRYYTSDIPELDVVFRKKINMLK